MQTNETHYRTPKRLAQMTAALFFWCGMSGVVSAVQDLDFDPEEVAVSQPTRIDWTFIMGPRSLDVAPQDWLKDYPEKQTYDLYIPDAYDPEGENGLILFVSPTPRAMAVDTWREVCDEMGLILAAPHGAGNQCYLPVRTKIVMDVLDDVRRKFQINPDRTYISGFSGGGRRACAIAFALPEYFGGVIPIGAAGELRSETWLRKRVQERISVAYVAGADDYNYCEIMSFRAPLLMAAGVRTKTWIVDGIGHEIPDSPHLIEAIKWLDEEMDQRHELGERSATMRTAGDQVPPTRAEQAKAFFAEATKLMQNDETKFDGQMLLKGISMRWGDTEEAQEARSILMLDTSWRQSETDQLREYMIHRCRGLDGYAMHEKHEHYKDQHRVRLEAAIMSWKTIIQDGVNQGAVKEAEQRIEVLEAALQKLDSKSNPSPDK